jgi:putative heme iron utilization protein
MPEQPSTSNLLQRAKELLKTNRSGTIATFSAKHPGFPFASVVNYSVSAAGEPVFLLSSMATHSKNLRANPNVSLMVSDGDDLSKARMTLIGTVKPVHEAELAAIKGSHLKSNPDAQQWVDFGDFQFFQMTIVDCYMVAGFGAMGWIAPDEFLKN